MFAMNYGTVYVASVALGAKDEHTLKAFMEAETFDGPALIIAYSHCIAHGINMTNGMQDQKAAVQSGQWLLYRFNPEKAANGENPFHLDSASPTLPLIDYLKRENRFKLLSTRDANDSVSFFQQALNDVELRRRKYEHFSNLPSPVPPSLDVPK